MRRCLINDNKIEKGINKEPRNWEDLIARGLLNKTTVVRVVD